MKWCRKRLHRYAPIPGYRNGCPKCHKAYKKNWNNQNRTRYIETATDWKRHNPEPAKKHKRISDRRRLYGLEPEDYFRMLTKQKGKCAICRVKADQELYVDHNHDTNKIRGLLCNRCNLGLGHFKDNTTLLDKASRYLKGKRWL